MDIDEPEIKVRKDYVPVYARADVGGASKAMQKCPICAQEIAADELQEHMRIEMLDPRFAAEKKAQMDKHATTSLATGQEITSALGKVRIIALIMPMAS